MGLGREQGPAQGLVQPDSAQAEKKPDGDGQVPCSSTIPYLQSRAQNPKNVHPQSYVSERSPTTGACTPFLWEKSSLCECAEVQHPTAQKQLQGCSSALGNGLG